MMSDDDRGSGDLAFQYNENDVNIFFEKVMIGVGNIDAHLKRLGEGLKKACEENNLIQVIRGTVHLAVIYHAETMGSRSMAMAKGERTLKLMKKARRQRRKKRRLDDSTSSENEGSNESQNDDDDEDKQSIRSDLIGVQGEDVIGVEEEDEDSSRSMLPEDIEINPDSVSESGEDSNSAFPNIEDFDILQETSGSEGEEESAPAKTSSRKRNNADKLSVKENLRQDFRVYTAERPFPCPRPGCGKKFKEKGSLTRHLLIHTGKRPFKCRFPGCSAAFVRLANLNRHKEIHARPFQCDFQGCLRTFKGAGSLKKHKKIHTRPKIQCDFPGCSQAFTREQNLKRHQNIHSRPTFLCGFPGCSAAFNRSDRLQLHVNTHEN